MSHACIRDPGLLCHGRFKPTGGFSMLWMVQMQQVMLLWLPTKQKPPKLVQEHTLYLTWPRKSSAPSAFLSHSSQMTFGVPPRRQASTLRAGNTKVSPHRGLRLFRTMFVCTL